MNNSWMKKFISAVTAFALSLPLFYCDYTKIDAADTCEVTATFSASVSDEEMFLKYAENILDTDLDFSDDYSNQIETSSGAMNGMFGASSGVLNSSEKMIYNTLRTELLKVSNGIVSDAVFRVEGLNLTGSTSKEAFTKNISHTRIMNYLLLDMPYELYWFDKTGGMSVSWDAYSSGGIYTVTAATFSFKVSKDYSAGGLLNTTLADTSKTGAVNKTASNARSVVSQNSGKSDLDKLIAYRDYICSQVSYNQAAVDNNYDYGDPWQLIYAFDNDPSTNIVCEGYSKAFQYLCELSSFSGEVICRSVSGSMGGPHMWNIVTIGGKNYLVDITNCDAGSIGYPDKLFLKGMSGSVSGGYSKVISSRTVKYTYDSSMSELYGTAALTLSSSDYDGSQAASAPSVPQNPVPSSPVDNQTSVNTGKVISASDASYGITGYGTVEGWVETDVLKVVLPTQSIDFTIDPQGLIKKSGAVKYSGNVDFNYGNKDNGFVFFRTLSSSGTVEYSDSISLSAYNKSSYPVNISASAAFSDTSGKVKTDSDGLFDTSDKNNSIYFSIMDKSTRQMVSVKDSSAAVLNGRKINDIKQAYSFRYGSTGYLYMLDETALRSSSNPAGIEVPEYSVVLNASCNPNADWTGVSMKGVRLSVVWTVTK